MSGNLDSNTFEVISGIISNEDEYNRVIEILSSDASESIRAYFEEYVLNYQIIKFEEDREKDPFSYVTWQVMLAIFATGVQGVPDAVSLDAPFSYYDQYIAEGERYIEQYGESAFTLDPISYPSLLAIFDVTNDQEILLISSTSLNWLLNENCLFYFATKCKERLVLAKSLLDNDAWNSDVDLAPLEVPSASEAEEEATEQGADVVAVFEALDTFMLFLSNAYNISGRGTELIINFVRGVFAGKLPSGGSTSGSSGLTGETQGFLNLFSGNGVNSALVAEDVDSSMSLVILNKLIDTGLLELASYIGEISEFAKKRLASKSTVIENANDFVIPEADLEWMLKLAEVRSVLQSDPLFFSQVVYYFPGLTTFFLDTIAVVVDYSNNGLGGGHDEENRELFLQTLKEAFGNGTTEFKLASEFDNTQKRIEAAIAASPFRSNTSPESPDIFHLRLGAANFYVPPVSIDVNTRFKTGSLVGGALRQKNSPKFNTGYKETVISMRLFFPNYQEIWGISLDPGQTINLSEDFKINFNKDSDKVIDKFLSSLRGLVAAFRYSPILPLKNHYLNSVHGITGVCLSSMSISTIPGYPFALAVDLELLNFNHKPFLPMISDFNQAVHWGKYRGYMGKAAIQLHNYVNETFLLKTSDSKGVDQSSVNYVGSEQSEQDIPIWLNDIPEADRLEYLSAQNGSAESNRSQSQSWMDNLPEEDRVAIEENAAWEAKNTLKTNIVNEWVNGNHLTLYVPAEVQSKIFLPDTSSFRSPQEEYLTDLGESSWEQVLKVFGIDITNVDNFSEYGSTLSEVVNLSRNNQYRKSTYNLVVDSIDLLLAGTNGADNREQQYMFLIEDFIQANSNTLDQARKDWLNSYSTTEQGLYLSQYSDPGPYRYKGNVLTIVGSSGSSENMNLSQVKYFFWKSTQGTEGAFDYLVAQEKANITNRTGQVPDHESVVEEVRKAFNVNLYERFFKSNTIQSVMEAARMQSGNFTFNEWEVPMLRIDLDPRLVVIDGLYVTLGNNFAKLQVQMQDEPSYQHIGGKDSFIDIKMTVFGEKELIKIKKIFDHISALARLEQAAGVIGFLGLKNVVTALSGIKYVMPLNYTVSTKPGFPHVYDVTLKFIDFDIFQQKREKLDSKQQTELVKHFTTKKNPFLRIKQMWSYFNAYPDFPLQIKNAQGETVGHLDPDFYFRSFEMFDDDIINNITTETPRAQSFVFESEITPEQVRASGIVATSFREIIQGYDGTNISQIAARMARYVIENDVDKKTAMIALKSMMSWSEDYFGQVSLDTNQKWDLLTSFINFKVDEDNELNPFFEEVSPGSNYSIGNISPSDYNMVESLENALAGQLSLTNEEFVSFHPDEVDFHKVIHLIPALSPDDVRDNKVSAILITAIGNYFGYINRDNGRFYLTNAGGNVQVDEASRTTLVSNLAKDVGTPDTGISKNDPPFSGIGQSLARYQNAYDGDEYKHWEKMLVDTKYRDISGRMIRAFPTYMLWLIDEGGYFAGMKLFDNFYGLQSVIDFSVVSSEDILGDTLIFRVSNMYSKLTTNESSKIFNPNIDDYNLDSLSLTEGLAAIVNRTLNMSRNILSHMRNEYVVDIESIRLKPGVRVHLRGGYGSNPNSLQTLFNGIITNVEQGEIVTVTAQSDAIELGALVNSTNKKGDSGKIDGGIDTGFWLSEPRDLMVRLLSMGSSRAREAIALSYGGIIFSENRFGIRHFGTTLYDALTDQERLMHQGKIDKLTNAFEYAGNGEVINAAKNFTTYTADLVFRIFAANANDIDLEIFKRNIYPGNGTGIAQFLGGDLDDGWSTVSTLVDDDFNQRSSSDLAQLTDVSWNRLLSESQNGGAAANLALDNYVSGNEIYQNGNQQLWSTVLGAGTASVIGGLSTAMGGVFAGIGGTSSISGLLGIMTGRSGTSLWRTMGVLSSNPDDDLAGFDEVSFRAQTYMRTVWDMFQVCARLLPNYIVAVRSFEDRSTIFYGKPHWLYTSGVVPVTTGYVFNESPVQRQPDSDLVNMLDSLNASTNQLADYSAFFGASEVNTDIRSVADRVMEAMSNPVDDQGQAMGVERNEFLPTPYVLNKIINFSDSRNLEFLDPDNPSSSSILCRIPVSTGLVDIGFHLPIAGEQGSGALSAIHQQISNLPPRYGFPFFTDTDEAGSYDGSSYDYVDNDEFSDTFDELREIEKQHLEDSDQTLINESGYLSLDDIDLDFVGIEETSNQKISEFIGSLNAALISMPSPSESVDSEVSRSEFLEWGMPNTPADEQFYIAMKWPVSNTASSSGSETEESNSNTDTANSETDTADSDSGDSDSDSDTESSDTDSTDVSGGPADYKLRKVLVFNPSNGRAVVCRPVYPLWGSDDDTVAVVSPDAAFYLGLLSPQPKLNGGGIIGAIDSATDFVNFFNPFGEIVEAIEGQVIDGDGLSIEYDEEGNGFRESPVKMQCLFSFVPDEVPVGVIADAAAPARLLQFDTENTGSGTSTGDGVLVGFGAFSDNARVIPASEATAPDVPGSGSGESDPSDSSEVAGDPGVNAFLDRYVLSNNAAGAMITDSLPFGGNVVNIGSDRTRSYFDIVFTAEYDLIDRGNLYSILDQENEDTNSFRNTVGVESTGGATFVPVYSLLDEISVTARKFYDEDYDVNVSVIAGDGRTLIEAQEIWDQFRGGYHTYDSVKEIFSEIYGMDPDSDVNFPNSIVSIIMGESDTVLSKFGPSAMDEFALLLGEDWLNSPERSYTYSEDGLNYSTVENGAEEAIEFIRETFIDAPASQGGLVETLNNFLIRRLEAINKNFFDGQEIEELLGFQVTTDDSASALSYAKDNIKTPRQLFLLLVGLFRQKMWSDPYARAWLVLRPDRKVWDNGDLHEKWSFRPVDRIFRAYIDPYNDYAKKKDKFLQLLVATKAEGNSSSDVFSYAANSIGDFFSKNVSPIWSALTNGLTGLINMYKLSMQQMGYALNQANDFRKHAHIMNKALNDSIYYSLGREGSILRAVDNPFTREYGEPVIEIREPFQRIHYISSFSHILSNQIQENINGVATTVTAVSDGKYPVTVALDKGAPAERQIEKTVETGLYFDNMIGEGFFGFLHPLMHPMETARGVTKNATGTPDELSAKRIALAHLKESIKDIYLGEIIVIGNADIRPHDLVYLADVYERIYGLFEVEQVVHHFTSDMGFITSITPNALVTVNDPAKWYLTSWFNSWLNAQTLRNDTRIYLDTVRDGSSGIIVGGNVSIDGLSEVLGPQMVGGIQFTHGSSAIVKDTIALEAAKHLPNSTASAMAGEEGGSGFSAFAKIAAGISAATTAAVVAPGASVVGYFGAKLAWNGFKWVRDNILDQHGCYVQYLNRNGRPMDAGLSYNQGMVAGEYHSKALLPGILGIRAKVRTPEGYAYVRTDDLFKSLGWRETEINSLTRYISLENALIHARVLQLGGLGPEKAQLEPQFKVLVKVKKFIDGDTLELEDVINPNNVFKIRFDGINTSETNVIDGNINFSDPNTGEEYDVNLELLDINTPGGRAKQFVYDKLRDKVFVARINKSRSSNLVVNPDENTGIEDYYDAGSEINQSEVYAKDKYERTIGTLFYHMPEAFINLAKNRVESILRNVLSQGLSSVKDGLIDAYKQNLGDENSSETTPVFYRKFDQIYRAISLSTSLENYFDYTNSNDVIVSQTGEAERDAFNILVYMASLESVYQTAAKWPITAWDEYYEDGYPVSLNWELVINNLARVYVGDLQFESESVVTTDESTPMPVDVI